jgi:DNA repair protein RecN (Recombination protein N)
MLTVLRIQNLALVEDLTWELRPGLIAVTGETGAGKSVIVGAIKLVLGERADRGLIRTGEESCTVQAMFHLPAPSDINAILEANGFSPCEDGELHVRRVVATNGTNRQFINGSPCPLHLLKAIGESLVDLHGAHDHHSLMSRERQLALLDKYVNHLPLLEAYQSFWKTWRQAIVRRNEIRDARQATESEAELLRHQVTEIEAADLKEGEDEELGRRYRMVSHQKRIAELGGHMMNLLNEGESSVLESLQQIQKSAGELERIDPALSSLFEGLEKARIDLVEVDISLRDYLLDIELEPAELAALEDRINIIESLKRKYGRTIPDILATSDKAAQKLALVENREEELAKLDSAVKESREALDKAALALSASRHKQSPKLAKAIATHLDELGFHKAHFEIAFSALPEPGSQGHEEIDFLFSPNPGEPPKPLRIIASSGEMARVMLAVKCALAEQDSIPLLIFDEIDANVGGSIAEAVGLKMKSLASSQQVIAITHLPQVASRGDIHYVVTKDYEGGRTKSLLRETNDLDRIEEIARMLGGSQESARNHARSLLGLESEPSAKASSKKSSRPLSP